MFEAFLVVSISTLVLNPPAFHACAERSYVELKDQQKRHHGIRYQEEVYSSYIKRVRAGKASLIRLIVSTKGQRKTASIKTTIALSFARSFLTGF